MSHGFVFQADHPLKGVSLVGSFNGWNKAANPMTVAADGLTWRLDLPLSPGRYVYKFVQFGEGDEKWVADPGAPLDETDKVNDNSLLIVSPAGYEIPASSRDGITARGALSHQNGARDTNYEAGKIELFLRARPGDLSRIDLLVSGQKYPMKLVQSEGFYASYGAKVPWNRQSDLTYRFELQDGARLEEFGANGLQNRAQPFVIRARDFRPYLLSNPTEPLRMNGPLTTQSVAGPEWAKNQPIYEVNLDAYGFATGTAIREYEKQLPVLKEMGAGMLWFMPLYPRGQKKGFGSPYAVRDYTDINPDLGTKADFHHLIERAHALGLRVLMDFVPNHTAWDNPLITEHPEFYVKDDKGEIAQAFTWADTAQLDYGRPGAWNLPLWNVMRDAMAGWVRDFGIDGFRCDVAGSNGRVPVEFWTWLRPQLEAIRPVFLLAEADNSGVHPAFDMNYSWELPPLLWDICAARAPASAIDAALRKEARDYPIGAIQMRFLDNHDWHPHADWGWGDKPAIDTQNGLPQVAPLMVLCATLPGKPLLYNGQEMGFLKTDPPRQAGARRASPVWDFYRQLLALYQNQPAINAGNFTKIVSDHDDKIYAFTRQQGVNRALIIVNLSPQPQSFKLQSAALSGTYREWFSGRAQTLGASPALQLKPWDYQVFVAN